MAEALISPRLFDFLRELKANNERAWFWENRARYEADVRDPLLRFVAAFGDRLETISPRFVADPRPVGGSMFRLHRDTRFSKDKSPYKTHAALHFRHEASTRDVHGPGFYLHLEPSGCFMGAGIWRPDPGSLQRIREAIVDEPDDWVEVREGVGSIHGDRLKRPPAGFDPKHPLIEDLKQKDFIASRTFSEAEACGPDFVDRYAEACRERGPLMRFLTRAVGLAWE
jgi:uncharacterized protein (TIGR02453 family)